ncbi:MAG: hypothetical protein K0S51_1210 [Bacillales bacterium]|nr:hypothetical protein [Bacillales bacterium]
MLRKLFSKILLISVLGACGLQEESRVINDSNSENIDKGQTILLDEIVTSIKDQGLELKEADLPTNNIFMQKLNEISPKTYSLDNSTLSIYVFQTDADREEGLKEFEKSTATVKLEPHKTFAVKNTLVFYVQGEKEVNNKLSSAIQKFN